MEKDEMMIGLEEALTLLREHIPVLDAWTAIKAVRAALTWAKEAAVDG